MPTRFRYPILLTAAVAFILGVVSVLAAEAVDRYTSTDAFCTSCHSMSAFIAAEAEYRTSLHRRTPTGVRAGCADCHIPPGLVAATWAHVKGGVKDIWVEATADFSTPRAWNLRRDRLARNVRDWMTANDSATCRRCHEMDAIETENRRGREDHASAVKEGKTCIECHQNLVHAPVRKY